MEISEVNPNNEEPFIKNLVIFFSTGPWIKIRSYLPSWNLNFLTKVTHLRSRRSQVKYSRRKSSLPLPLPISHQNSALVETEASLVFEVLDDIQERILSNLHDVQKSLQFWQARSESTDSQKVYFMVFERGPRAFLHGLVQLINGYISKRSPIQVLSHSASANIFETIAVLTGLQRCLATFLAQAYVEVNKFGGVEGKDLTKSLSSLLMTMNGLFLKIEESLSHVCANHEVKERNSIALHFERIPDINPETFLWTDYNVEDAVDSIYQNLHKLDSYLSYLLVSRYRKPRKMTLYWLQYTCGAIGLSACSIWLLRHSHFMGSSDIDNWIRDASETTIGFWKDHVEQPFLSIRDELFETFRRRHKGVMELEEVQLTANSLHRMLLTFSEQTKGQKFPEDASDQEMLEIVMTRYEKELMHPISNLLGGELARALLIQIQKLKLDLETAMLELNQILNANEINFAILAALPAFFLSLLLLMLARTWMTQDKGAEGRGRIARIQRRLLVVDVEKRIMQYQTFMDSGSEDDARWMFGLVLYSLDRLYRSVKKHAKESGEWLSLKQDIIELGKPEIRTAYKLMITSRMERVYDCLLPSTKRR